MQMIQKPEKKNVFLYILVITFIFILTVLIFIFVYDKITNGNIEEEEKKLYENNVVLIDKNFDNLITSLEDDMFIRLIGSNTKLSDINNGEILNYLIDFANKKSQNYDYGSTVKGSELKELHDNSLVSNISYYDEDINWLGQANGEKEWKYSVETKTYTKVAYGHGYKIVSPIFKKLDSYKKDGNIYTLSYKYGFCLSGEVTLVTSVYGTYEDAKSEKNSIYEVDEGINNKDLGENYEIIKDKMDTYTYVVEVNDNNVILKDFYIK